MCNTIAAKTTSLKTAVYNYLKIPAKPLFYRIFIATHTIKVKKAGVQFLAHPLRDMNVPQQTMGFLL